MPHKTPSFGDLSLCLYLSAAVGLFHNRWPRLMLSTLPHWCHKTTPFRELSILREVKSMQTPCISFTKARVKIAITKPQSKEVQSQ